MSQCAAEAAGRWRIVNIRTSTLDPTQDQIFFITPPTDVDAPFIHGQGAVFGGIGREFMNDQRDTIGRMLTALN